MTKELKLTNTKGGSRHPIDFKDFIISHLTQVGEDYQANIHRAYKEQLKILAEQTGRRNFYHQPSYTSFNSNFRKLLREGIVVFSGREEKSDDPKAVVSKVAMIRKYVRLAAPGDKINQ